MDEYLQAAFSILIPDGFYHGYDPVKTVLFAYFYDVARLVTSDAVSLMIVARLQGLVLSVGIVALVVAIARNLGRSRLEALFSGAVLLSFSNYMERSFRVRSDTLATFLIVLALWAATRSGSPRRDAALAGFAVGAAFLSTQKAVFGVAAVGLALAPGLASREERSTEFRTSLVYGAAFLASLLTYGVAFGGRGLFRVLRMVFLSPVDNALHGGEAYRDLFLFVEQTLERNIFAYALCGTGVVFAAAGWRSRSTAERRALVATVVLTALVFLHNQPWPYVFVLAVAPLALFAPEVSRLLTRWGAGEEAALGTLLVVLAFSFPRNIRYVSHDNLIQRETVREAELLLGPGDRYLDGTWMVATRRQAGKIWWDAVGVATILREAKEGRFDEIKQVFEEQPKIVLINYRTQSLKEILAPWIDGSYVRIYSNVLVTGSPLGEEAPATFQNRWCGRYALYALDGQLKTFPYLIDGREVRGEVDLPTGTYHVGAARGTGDGFLLPAGLKLPASIPERRPPYDLFAGVYD